MRKSERKLRQAKAIERFEQKLKSLHPIFLGLPQRGLKARREGWNS